MQVAAAETFLDEWMEMNIAHHYLHPRATVESLTKRCLRDARQAGIPTDQLEKVVGDLEESISDELVARHAHAVLAGEEEFPNAIA